MAGVTSIEVKESVEELVQRLREMPQYPFKAKPRWVTLALHPTYGELITVLLTADGRVIDQQTVSFMVADVIFLDLPAGNYIVIARHPSLRPIEARQDVSLPENVMLGVKYFYTETERQLLRIELDVRRLDV